MSKTAVIIGAGPAGLTAAFELIKSTDIKPVIFEATSAIGGISRTVNYKGNRMDIGGHRFFSKSDRVMAWWQALMPTQGVSSGNEGEVQLKYRGKVRPVSFNINGPDPETTDLVMLVRSRLSRIYYLRKFFNYPITLSLETVANLGALRMARIGYSYLMCRLNPIKNEASLEDFLINRFGKELYLTFFKDYTEKVWGIPCNKIDASWGAQRIKALSIGKVLLHAARKAAGKFNSASISQKETETSLIEQFLYPKFGPGQMWEEVARLVCEQGSELHLDHTVVGIRNDGNRILSVTVQNSKTGEQREIAADYFFSTMPVKDLIACLRNKAPETVQSVAEGLAYRDFITVGLLLKKLKLENSSSNQTAYEGVLDNWIYIQERDVKVGRLQVFNNWSPYMVSDSSTVWIGLEYFVQEGDDLWTKSDLEMAQFGIKELASIDIIEPGDVLDHTVIRVKKTYPAYFGTYQHFGEIREYIDQYTNLFLIGRNGMHKYNNQDHSMLSAMQAVENIVKGQVTKDNIWAINAEQDYHEEK